MSHFYQLQHIVFAKRSKSINKTVIEVPFQSYHFKDVNFRGTSLCEIFVYPEDEVQCSCELASVIGKSQSLCHIAIAPINATLRNTKPEQYFLNSSNSILDSNIDLSKMQCIAGSGYIISTMSLYKDAFKNRHKSYFPIHFRPFFVELISIIKEIIWVGTDPQTIKYVGVHWRRGDQLNTRCLESDKSINCDSVHDFIDYVEKLRASKKAVHLPIYVATNEANRTIMRDIHMAGYYTAANFTIPLRQAGGVIVASDDLYLLEMALLCDAYILEMMGHSSSNNFVKQCRLSNNKTAIIFNKV